MRWFLLPLLPPEDRRAVVERELVFSEEEVARLEEIHARTDPAHPFRATVELGLRLNAVMQDWLREQL